MPVYKVFRAPVYKWVLEKRKVVEWKPIYEYRPKTKTRWVLKPVIEWRWVRIGFISFKMPVLRWRKVAETYTVYERVVVGYKPVEK
ncbi:MAG: hypothetical protein DRJ97_04380 [Thermoprotei archaeon]|nr:MAG: hypothetical protein DRJ97_04380 [Thermoprotei archaeon]